MEDSNYHSDNSNNGKGIQRGHWRPEEDDKLKLLVRAYGARNWNTIAESIEGRTGKSCRLRWFNQLDPKINKGPFTKEEEDRLLEAHRIHGNKWSNIASLFPGRTDNALKNHYHVVTARKRREGGRSPGPAGASWYHQKPSETLFDDMVRYHGHYRGIGTPYPFQYQATLSSSCNNTFVKDMGSGPIVASPNNSTSFGFRGLGIGQRTQMVEKDKLIFTIKDSRNAFLSGSSRFEIACGSGSSTTFRLFGLSISAEAPSAETSNLMILPNSSWQGEVEEGSTPTRNIKPFIDFLGVGDKY